MSSVTKLELAIFRCDWRWQRLRGYPLSRERVAWKYLINLKKNLKFRLDKLTLFPFQPASFQCPSSPVASKQSPKWHLPGRTSPMPFVASKRGAQSEITQTMSNLSIAQDILSRLCGLRANDVQVDNFGFHFTCKTSGLVTLLSNNL